MTEISFENGNYLLFTGSSKANYYRAQYLCTVFHSELVDLENDNVLDYLSTVISEDSYVQGSGKSGKKLATVLKKTKRGTKLSRTDGQAELGFVCKKRFISKEQLDI